MWHHVYQFYFYAGTYFQTPFLAEQHDWHYDILKQLKNWPYYSNKKPCFVGFLFFYFSSVYMYYVMLRIHRLEKVQCHLDMD